MTSARKGSERVKKQLIKDKERAIVSGVCAGLGVYCNVEPWIFRGLFVLPIFMGFFMIIPSIVLYIVLANILSGKRSAADDHEVVEVEYEVVEDHSNREDIEFKG